MGLLNPDICLQLLPPLALLSSGKENPVGPQTCIPETVALLSPFQILTSDPSSGLKLYPMSEVCQTQAAGFKVIPMLSQFKRVMWFLGLPTLVTFCPWPQLHIKCNCCQNPKGAPHKNDYRTKASFPSARNPTPPPGASECQSFSRDWGWLAEESHISHLESSRRAKILSSLLSCYKTSACL